VTVHYENVIVHLTSGAKTNAELYELMYPDDKRSKYSVKWERHRHKLRKYAKQGYLTSEELGRDKDGYLRVRYAIAKGVSLP